MWFERNRNKDHGDMTQNPTCVKITRSIFMNKKTISFRVYQANRLEQRAENQYVAGIIIMESSCSSTEESDYKSLSYDSKGNYVQQMRDRDTLIEQLFYTICVFCTVRVWYVPYAYGIYHTRTVRFSVPYAYGIDIRVWYVPYAYYAFSQPCHHLATMGCLYKHF